MSDERDEKKESALVLRGSVLPAETIDFEAVLNGIDEMTWFDQGMLTLKIADHFAVCEQPLEEHIEHSLRLLEKFSGNDRNVQTLKGYQAIYNHPRTTIETKKTILTRYAALAQADHMDYITLAKEMKNYFDLGNEPKELHPLIAQVAASFASSKWPENRGNASNFLYDVLMKNDDLSPGEKLPFKKALEVYVNDANEHIQQSVRRDMERYEQFRPQAEGLDDKGFVPQTPFL